MNRNDYIKCLLNEGALRIVFIKEDMVFNVSSAILDHIMRIIQNETMTDLILDISNVNHIDSSAVGLFITLKHEMKKRGLGFRLEGVNENVQRIFRLLDVMKYIEAA